MSDDNTTHKILMGGNKNTRFQRKRAVTLPVIKLEKGQTRFLALLCPMYTGERIDDSKDPATLIKAADMETGEFGVIIAPTIMQNELVRNYSDHGYVGRGFEVTITRQTGKDYNHVTLIEVGIPEDIEGTINQLRVEANAHLSAQSVDDADTRANTRAAAKKTPRKA